MNYRSLQDMNRAILAGLSRLPDDLCLIVGVPRSGLLAANLLALHLNLPLTDVHGLLAGRLLGGGERCGTASIDRALAAMDGDERGSILVLDDSISTGQAMRRVCDELADFRCPQTLRFAAVFATDENTGQIDIHFEQVPRPRVFEWNVLHHGGLNNACVDIDGVLCRDPSEQENDDGPRYLDFLNHVRPRVTPRYEIAWLVTSRLEKYREATEAWLARHHIRYRHLLMLDLPDAATRRRLGAAAPFKSRMYHQTHAGLFIESDPAQAAIIAQRTGKPVFCVQTHQMWRPGAIRHRRHAARQWIGKNHWRLRLAVQRAFAAYPTPAPCAGEQP